MYFVIACSLLSACKTLEQPENRSGSLQWSSSLEESVKPITVAPLAAFQAPLATHTESKSGDERWAYGFPKNLTQPIAVDARQGDPRSIKDAGSNSRSRTVEPYDVEKSQVFVQVNNGPSPSTEASFEDKGQATGVQESRLEELYGGHYQRQADRDLEQFGYDMFSSGVSRSGRSGPVPAHYLIGAGDEIQLSFSGSFDAYHVLKVDRNGAISIPNVGPVNVAGVAFAELESVIDSFVKQRRTGYELKVTLGSLRTIQIYVVGRVEQPGFVDVSVLDDLVTVLSQAGGPSKDGSLRKIKLVRNEQIVAEIDLYEVFVGGDSLSRYQLMDADSVVVPPIGATVGIAGYVQQPAIYELKEKTIRVRDVLSLAGGLTPFSFTPKAHLEKTVKGRGREKIDIALEGAGLETPMQDGEMLLVEAVEMDRQTIVRIEGQVVRPGDYPYRPGMKLSELIERSEGLTVDAYLPQVFISRQIGEAEVVEDVPGRSAHRQTRRVVVSDLSKAMSGDEQHDILLMPLDLVTVRSQQDSLQKAQVEVIGAVQRPGVYELTVGMRVSDLVAIAGNPMTDVYYDEAELIRRVFDEKTRRLDVDRFRFDLRDALSGSSDPAMNPMMLNGDLLVIRSLQKAQVRATIGGFVRFPGEYVFPDGAKITDLIAAAGGLLQGADLRAASFRRESTRQLQSKGMQHLSERTRRLYEAALENMVQRGSSSEGIASKVALEQTMNTLQRMQQTEVQGRIIVPFQRADFPESDYNLTLQNGDDLMIPRYEGTVSVAGHVFRPISLIADDSITVQDALEQAGGLTEYGDKELVYVIRADGRIDSVAQSPARLSKTTKLLGGDVLLVPRKPMERTFTAELGDVLGLVRQLAEVSVIGSQIGNDIDMTLVRSIYEKLGATDANTLLTGNQ